MPEEELYKPIEDMFANEGYLSISSRSRLPTERVHSAFGVEVHGATKKIDVVAFRWTGNGGLEAKAVECKPGRSWEAPGAALGQATAYQRLFPHVYVASEATEDNLKHVDSLLRHLGLGYITVSENRAEEIFPPGANTRFNQREFQLQVHAKAALLLAAREVFGKENFQFGRADEPSNVWVSTLEACNISSTYNSGEEKNFWFCLNLEKKEAVRRVFNTLNPADFYNFLSKLPSDYVFWLAKIESYRPKKYVDEQYTAVPDITLSKIRKWIDTIQSWGWQAHIQVGREKHLDNIAKEKIVSELNKSIADLSPLQEHMSTVLRR